ncbi:hypothetical protein IFM89_036685 [Coptis chinensis]|uniref:Patellin-1-6 C-terminal GOLD domain-containing protein n=1 Tax=Coptis chinensis TaxID=261450 RepID=A0A835M0J5_9MAGN|nr:hypothetical protein IFM89_036685 [Coptis chinensis]
MAPGRPPRTRVTSQSQATQPAQDGSSVAKKREPRKKTQNLILKNHLARGGGKPRIEIAIGKDRPICNWSQQWITELGVIARFRIPPFAHYWKDVTDDQRKSLHKLVLEKFDMDIHLPHVETTVNNYIRDRFRDHRCALHKYYVRIPNNVNKRQHPFNGVSQDSWERWCDLWETDKFKDVSTHNQYSRSCLVVNHCAGSKSFVRIRGDMPVDPETQQEAGMIALYHKTHFSEKKGWVSHEAENNYERMVELQNQPTPEGSNPLTEEEIFDEVLGVRPGYKHGLGHGEAPHPDGVPKPKIRSSFVKGGEKVNLEIDGIEAGATITWELVVDGWELDYAGEFVRIFEKSYTIAIGRQKNGWLRGRPFTSTLGREYSGAILAGLGRLAGATITWVLVVGGWELDYAGEFVRMLRKATPLLFQKAKWMAAWRRPFTSTLGREYSVNLAGLGQPSDSRDGVPKPKTSEVHS